MKTILSILLLLGMVSIPTFAAQERAIDQAKDAQHAGKEAAKGKSDEDARTKAGDQFDRPYDRPKGTPEVNEAPSPGKPQKVN
jgi:hypothetical protein